MFCFVSFRFVSFRFVSFHSVPFRSVPFRFVSLVLCRFIFMWGVLVQFGFVGFIHMRCIQLSWLGTRVCAENMKKRRQNNTWENEIRKREQRQMKTHTQRGRKDGREEGRKEGWSEIMSRSYKAHEK